MGHDLTRMMLAGMPGDWTTGERLVALVVADHCSDRTHSGYVSNAVLCEETGLAPQTVRRNLASLARRGYELRVPIGTGANGMPVYTHRGRATDYLVPILPPREKGSQSRPSTPRKGRQSGAPSGEKGSQSESVRSSISTEWPAEIDYPNPLTPQATPIDRMSVVTTSVEGSELGDGGASRQPIERQAWLAIERWRCNDPRTRTPQTSTRGTSA